jgi:deoxyinosine 3'endonuclease (endonuclease V)
MLTEEAAVAIQEELRPQVICNDMLPDPIRIIAGTDVEYDKDTQLIAGSIVLLDYETLAVQYRLPETTRLADHYARLALLEHKKHLED